MALTWLIAAPVIWGLRIVLGLLLIIAGALKVPDLRAFHVILVKYNILPRMACRPVAYSLPFVEITCGAWLLMGVWLPWAALAALLHLLGATGMVFLALLKRRTMANCGCFGTAIKVPLNWKKFWENLLWVALAAWLTMAAWPQLFA